ncbi:MAG: site-specific DNA-methyltransferase [Alistipes sp.]|nr:site-specific DNA-methyltransferase [Alistipes sp.]MCI6628565.1 site-specific DNA-methyltransferase [Bacteroidales bacterium]MDY5200145.1 site-specific DNA-methyltransferase [Candidatus Cryptobacteroides sp.]
MDRLKMHTQDIVDVNVGIIGKLFPNCLTERIGENGRLEHAIDFDKLRVELSKGIVEGQQERYQFTWPGKREAMRIANTPTNMTLRPDRESSVDFDNTGNLYIEGDNLEVLKILREDYLGKVKMIYIDPPYNTGNDFVYEDDFSQTSGEFRGKSGMFDEDGNMILQNYEVNSESNGRFHTDWLNMIYPRLKVARDLLTEDGVIFISIDDNEVENLRKVCDEVFGERNKIAQLVIENNPRGRQSDTFFATSHEYLLCYAKNSDLAIIRGVPLSEDQKAEYKFSDKYGKYRLLGLRQRGVASLREDRPEMFFPIYVNPADQSISLTEIQGWHRVVPKKSDGREGRWMWGKQKCKTEYTRLVAKLISSRDEYDIYVKDYLNTNGEQRTRKYKTVWNDKTLNNQIGTQEVKAILGGDYMSFPKSTEYIKSIIQIGTSYDSLILDFFSGSATTAHAVMQLNAEDGGNRKYIMVQLPELTDEKSEAYKSGYKNICEIGKERIRRAGKKIQEEQAAKKSDNGLFDKESEPTRLDVGFRVLKLDTSNMQDVYYTPEDSSAATLFDDNVKPDRTPEDLLFQVMLECNLPLSAKIERKTIAGKDVFSVNDDYLIACFDDDVTEIVITEVARRKPYYFIMRDSSLSSDQVADNFEQIFNAYSKDTIRRIL